MFTEEALYYHNGLTLKGYIARKNSEKAPIVLVAHAFRGQDDFARRKAESLARLGYIGFAIDIYGEGRLAKNDEEAMALMTPLYRDRALLQGRMKAAFDAALAYSDKVGAIGFCFGGLAVIELLRSGAPLSGGVTFHAVLKSEGATRVPIAPSIAGSLLILHGNLDPQVSDEDISAIQNELTEAGVDWQMHIYSNTYHAFTNPAMHRPELGKAYNALSDKRSWQAMKNFLKEILEK